MIRLHGGRLLLVCDRADRTWHARVILGPKPEHQVEIDTKTTQLQEALQCAHEIYEVSLASIRPPTAPVMCWDCQQWEMTTQQCDLRIPESKRSGGRFAAVCELFDRAG